MAINQLLQDLIQIIQSDSPPAFFLNKPTDVYKFAQQLFQDVEDKRSQVTALTRQQALKLVKNNLQFSSVKHESRINTLYRIIGLPTELDLEGTFSLLDANKKDVTDKDALAKILVQREFEQLSITFKQFLQSNSAQDLNSQVNATQAQNGQLIKQLFDSDKININRLFPVVQFSQIQNVVEPTNRISPSFASTEERYVNGALTKPPFIESVIVIRLLQQSGGTKINTQGAVEDLILQSLGYALGDLVKQYHDIQIKAEKLLLDGIALIRNKISGISNSSLKQGDINANSRENDNIPTEGDIRGKYTSDQIKLYDAVISLLPTENDVIPIGASIDNVPFSSRGIKENALTGSFLNIINSNAAAVQRSIDESKKVMQKRQLTQDKLTADLSSTIGDNSGISLAEIIIVIASLFVLDEKDLVGLISKSRFDQLIKSTNNNTSASSSTITNDGQSDTPQKQINIFDILTQFKDNKTETSQAVQTLQNTIQSIYDAFVKQLGKAHIISNT